MLGLTAGRMMSTGILARDLTLSLVLPRFLAPGTIFCTVPLCSRLPAYEHLQMIRLQAP